ncbi:MAG: AAA family ATPase, partial [Desertimonas sp.]
MPTATDQHAEWFSHWFNALIDNVGLVIKGKRDQVALALVCVFAEGHLLLDDVPGTGKTSLAKSIAHSITGSWNRVQFTPDLLPSDVTGGVVYNQSQGSFDFRRGAVFANVVLGDEINRASPKTQAALLEVMEERHVTVDGSTYDVPRPFVVIATQNPVEQEGTYRLPEAQLDRFLMRTSLGYPSHDFEVDVLRNLATGARPESLQPVMSTVEVARMIDVAESVHVEDSIRSYVVRLVAATRAMP